MKRGLFLSGVMVCLGWLAIMLAAGEFTVFLSWWVEGVIRFCLLAVFCLTQFSYIRMALVARS